jgi:hypothetical protein
MGNTTVERRDEYWADLKAVRTADQRDVCSVDKSADLTDVLMGKQTAVY